MSCSAILSAPIVVVNDRMIGRGGRGRGRGIVGASGGGGKVKKKLIALLPPFLPSNLPPRVKHLKVSILLSRLYCKLVVDNNTAL